MSVMSVIRLPHIFKPSLPLFDSTTSPINKRVRARGGKGGWATTDITDFTDGFIRLSVMSVNFPEILFAQRSLPAFMWGGPVFIDRLPLLFESDTLKRSHRVPPGNGHGGCRVKCEMSSTPTASDLSWLPHAARS